MDQALKDKWLEALRSGQYKQGQACLKAGDKYCCLGVLCDISKKGQWADPPYSNHHFSRYYSERPELDGDAYVVPDFMADCTGLNGEEQDHLMRLNDDDDQTFDQIADWIEENIEAS